MSDLFVIIIFCWLAANVLFAALMVRNRTK